MKKTILLLVLGVFACNSKDSVGLRESEIDSTITSSHTTVNLGELYRGFGTNQDKLFVLNSKGDTVFTQTEAFYSFEFYDFNGDSLEDILIHYVTNVPGIQDLLLFDKTSKGFIMVKGFTNFPAPLPVPGTDYYYSYHRSGCADNLWDSDLFYIEDFETHVRANISGNECEGEKGIVISSVSDGEKEIVGKFALNVLEKYKDRKWGFIRDYWTTNYSRFPK